MANSWLSGILHRILQPDVDEPAGANRMKQVIVVNRSLKLPRGKLSAQVAHAAVGAFTEAAREVQHAWLRIGMPKIVLEASDEEQLLQLYEAALETGIPVMLIQDAGKTVIPEGTITCLGIGPAAAEDIDALTGDLKLLG